MKLKILLYGGCGSLARSRIIPALEQLAKDFEMEFAIVDKYPPNSERYKYYKAGEEPFDEYNVAIISTPNHTHAAIAKKALYRGLHVLCEKPISNTLETAREMLRAAEEKSSLVTMLSDHYLFKPVIRELREHWKEYEKLIGKLSIIKAEILESSPEERDWARCREKSGGGVAIDTGIHLVSILATLFGHSRIRVENAAIGRSEDAIDDCETYAQIALDINGVLGFLEVAKGIPLDRKKITFVGASGVLEVDMASNQIRLDGKLARSFDEDDSYPTLLRDFFEAIEHKTKATTEWKKGCMDLEVITYAYEMAQGRGFQDWIRTEYEQLCEAWRLRDRYVMEKINYLFLLTGITAGSAWIVSSERYSYTDLIGIRALIFFIGSMMSFVLNVSIARDIYYRDGTEELIKKLLRQVRKAFPKDQIGKLYDRALTEEVFPQKIAMDIKNWLEERVQPTWIDRYVTGLFVSHHAFTEIRHVAFLMFALLLLMFASNFWEVTRIALGYHAVLWRQIVFSLTCLMATILLLYRFSIWRS